MKNKHVNIPIFVPHNGCPNECSFCNQRKITGESDHMTAEKADSIISGHLSTIDRKKTNIEIAFFGGSFTGIPQKEQRQFLEVANKYIKAGRVDGIRISTRPDYISSDILAYLKEYGVTAIELGAQSMDNNVLFLNNRGHTALQTEEAAHLIYKSGFELGLQMMVGLYGDSDEGALFTTDALIALKPSCVRIYPTLVIKDTMLYDLFVRGKYKPLDIESAVELCTKLLLRFEQAGIKVLRIGLLASDNINLESDVVAGPFHPSFGELVESEKLWYLISEKLSHNKRETIRIIVNPRYVSAVVGNKKRNISRIKQNYRINEVNIVQSYDIPFGSFLIE